jgi:WD40 repeat protein
MSVSSTWNQICSYPLLWKNLYFEKEWTIAQETMMDFEARLQRLQAQIDSQLERIQLSAASHNACACESATSASSSTKATNNEAPSPHQRLPSSDLDRLYDNFFFNLHVVLDGVSSHSRLQRLRKLFSVIARIEIGEPFYRATTFTPNVNGSIRVHVDWRYLYLNRNLLESNWRGGHYEPILLDGAPDVTQPQQREGIYCVVFDHKLLAAGSRDNLIRLWNLDDYTYRGSLESHEGSVLCLQLDSKRNILVSGSSDSTIKVWNLETRQVVQSLCGHSQSVLGLHFEGAYIASCSRDSTARVWKLCESSEPKDALTSVDEVQGGEECSNSFPTFVSMHILRGHRAAVNSVHFRDNVVATASGDRTVRLWNLKTGTLLRTISAHSRGIACVNLIKKLVVTGSSDHVIKIISLDTGEEVRTLKAHTGLVRTIQTDNTKIISGSYDQTIRIWDINTGEMLQELSNHHDSKYVPPL